MQESSFSLFEGVEDPPQEVSARQPNTAATNIVALTLSNIELTSDLLQFLGKKLLPQLFCFELTDIRYVNTGKRKYLMDDLCGHICFCAGPSPWCGVTVQVNCRLMKPVRVGAILKVVGKFVQHTGGICSPDLFQQRLNRRFLSSTLWTA